MEGISLSEFVRLAIIEIAKGVENAKDELKDRDVLINPIIGKDGFISTDVKDTKRNVQELEFDLSVTASSESKSGVGGSINVVSLFSGGAKKEDASSNITTSRLRFSIPVSFTTNTGGRTPEEKNKGNQVIHSQLR